MRKPALFVILLGFLAVSGAIAYKGYQEHISPGVRQALASATDSASTSLDIDKAYLHDAMVQIRTQKDAELVGTLDKGIKSAEQWRQFQYDTGYDSAGASTAAQLEVVRHDREQANKSLTQAAASFIQVRHELGLPPGDFANMR